MNPVPKIVSFEPPVTNRKIPMVVELVMLVFIANQYTIFPYEEKLKQIKVLMVPEARRSTSSAGTPTNPN